MKDKRDLVRGWLTKAGSDLATADLILETQVLPKLAEIDLTQITDDGVAVRYDFEFWPDQSVAAAAVTLAEQVRGIILDVLPPECYPK